MAWLLSFVYAFTTLILLQSSQSAAQNKGRIPVGQSLTATTNGPSWLSTSGDFAFGFHPFNNTNDLFLLSVWFAKIPDTIVWHANNGDPVSRGSTIKIDPIAGLILNDAGGNQIWSTSSEFSSAGSVSYGFMNDTGNFALKSSSNDELVWQSFDHPTDTLLPTQIMQKGQESATVDSRLSVTNFTTGRFQLRLITDGNLVLNTKDIATNFAYGAYYISGTNDPNATNAGYQVAYEESGYTYILRENGSRVDLLPRSKTVSPAKDYYQRITLNYYGVLTWYYIPRNSTGEGWISIQSLPDNICTSIGSPEPDVGSGACGYNSICFLRDDKTPTCSCPPNYSLLDPSDPYSNCKPDFILGDCEAFGQSSVKGKYILVPIPFTDWPQSDYAKLDPISEDECKSSCIDDCFCAATIFGGGSGKGPCWKKKLPLTNGRQDNSVSRTAWLKVGNVSNVTGPSNPFVLILKEKNKQKTVVAVLLGGSVFANFCLLGAIGLGVFLIYHKKQIRFLDRGQGETFRDYSSVTCFGYQELEEATDGFKEEIGRGAFGVVYKGIIGTGGHRLLVAVKKLDRISQDADKEFKTEVNAVGQTHHKNLVRLVGFCKEEDQRLLVYEYMSNGTLADYLFGELKPSWVARIQIAQGIAKGLLYLHEECNTQIIHCDIKPQNILLDDYHNPRISDLGLAKLLVLNQTQTNTAIRGTKGYVAPEWFRNKPVTLKVDVYSFGVLLLEIICCRKSVCMEIMGDEKAILTDWAFDCYQSGSLDSLVSDDTEALGDRLQLHHFVMVALWCIQDDPTLRPTMRMVTQMLEGLAQVPSPPCPTSFSVTTQN